MIVTDYWKVPVFKFSGLKNTVFFWAKKLMERQFLLITEKFLFWTFGRWEILFFFWAKKVDGKMIFTDYRKVLVLKRLYLLITEKFLFWIFRRWEIRPLYGQKVDGKTIFTWSSGAFSEISGLAKYGFSCSVNSERLKSLNDYAKTTNLKCLKGFWIHLYWKTRQV